MVVANQLRKLVLGGSAIDLGLNRSQACAVRHSRLALLDLIDNILNSTIVCDTLASSDMRLLRVSDH
jgi:hypothetical protein